MSLISCSEHGDEDVATSTSAREIDDKESSIRSVYCVNDTSYADSWSDLFRQKLSDYHLA